MGLAIGWVSTRSSTAHYRGVYRTPLAFAIVTPDIALLAVTLSLVLGWRPASRAARRLVGMPPLELMTGRRDDRPAIGAAH